MWPLTKANTILNVCPQGERYVVERFGKLLDIKESGWFLGAYVVVRAFVDRWVWWCVDGQVGKSR